MSDGVDLGDYGLRLPGYKAPDSTVPFGARVPLDSKHPGAVVRSSTVDWEARARVAEAGAERLQGVIAMLAQAIPNNYFGDCVEGQQMYLRAKSAVEAWQRTLVAHRNALVVLATSCSRAAEDIVAADNTASSDILT